MAAKNNKKRAQRQAKRALKQKRQKAEASKRRKAETLAARQSGLPHGDPTEALLQELLARMPVDALGGMTEDWFDPRDRPPWANRCSYTHGAAKMLMDGNALPGRALPHPFVRAKLAACFGADPPFGLAWAHQASTEGLVQTLARLGATIDENTFRERAEAATSAWDLGASLVRDAEALDGVPAADIAGSTATALWSRWLPEHPCQELICDHMQRAYIAAESEDGAMAFRHGRAVQTMVEALHPGATLARLREDLHVLQNVENWLMDASMWMWNHAVQQPADAEAYLAWTRWHRGLDDGSETVANEADALGLLGRVDEGVDLLEAALVTQPRDAGLYARLADLLAWGPKVPEERLRQAVTVLDRAKALGVDGSDWDLDLRRADYAKLLQG